LRARQLKLVILRPRHTAGAGEAVDFSEYQHMRIGCVQSQVVSNFSQVSDNISDMLQYRNTVTTED